MNFEKKDRGVGSTQIPLPFFTVFNMGDPPTINVSKVLKCKINHNFFSLKNMTFPNGGRGGSPTWEKFPHFPVFFAPLFLHLLCYIRCFSSGRMMQLSLYLSVLQSCICRLILHFSTTHTNFSPLIFIKNK